MDKFRCKPGVNMIESGNYNLSDSALSNFATRQQPFERIFLPGRSINMSMVFETYEKVHGVCPVCSTANNETVGKYVTW